MDKAASTNWIMAEQDERLTETIGREQGRLRNFIRRRVADEADAEDILQDVFYELIEAYRLMKPIEQVGAWLYRVARNRIIDRFRKKKPEPFSAVKDPDDGERRFAFARRIASLARCGTGGRLCAKHPARRA